jgi:hypothetical protein
VGDPQKKKKNLRLRTIKFGGGFRREQCFVLFCFVLFCFVLLFGTLFLGSMYFSQIHTMPMHMDKDLKTLQPGGIRTRNLLFCRQDPMTTMYATPPGQAINVGKDRHYQSWLKVLNALFFKCSCCPYALPQHTYVPMLHFQCDLKNFESRMQNIAAASTAFSIISTPAFGPTI